MHILCSRAQGCASLMLASTLAVLFAYPAQSQEVATQPVEKPTVEASPAKETVVDPPAKALKYHRVLKRRPAPSYLFDRFFNAWTDEASTESLAKFLQEQAKSGDGSDGLLLAFFYAKQGDDIRAITQFRDTLAKDPGNAVAWYEKAVLEARALNFDTALEDLEKGSAAKPDAKLAIRIAKLRGKLLVRNRQRDKALAVFRKLIATNANDEELAEDVIELQVDEGLYEEAIKTSQTLVERTKDPYRKILRRLRTGDIHQQAGKRDKAVEIYRGALADVGAESWLEREILSQIERWYRREDDISALKKLYESMLKEYPKRVGIRRGYARVLVDADDVDGAIAQFEEIIAITPGDRGNQEAFVQLYLSSGKPAEAKKQLEALIKQYPEDGELYLQLASLAAETKDPAGAAAAVEDFLKNSDETEYAYLRAARLLERLKLNNQARKQYAALTTKFANSDAAKESHAAFLYKLGDKEQAIELWLKAAAGDDPQQAIRVARSLAARQEHEKAYELLNERLDDFDNDGLFLGQLISEALALKKYNEAIPLARRRVDLAESSSELEDAVAQAGKVIEKAESYADTIKELTESSTPQRICLRAELLQRSGAPDEADLALKSLVEEGNLLALGQQMRLARLRQDWPAAIAAVKRMIDTPDGRKSRNVRTLVELYDRNYQLDEALKWVATWKKLSPGSTTPWLVQSRLLLAKGEEEAALDTLKTASKEYEGASEIQTRLAMLYSSLGKWADAERIYWKTYENTEDLLTKIRAVEQLARTAEQQGKTEALVSNLQERRQENRTSIEPLMALAAVHRVTNNYEKRLQTLAEAAKMRPDDLQLLRQIARIEEKEGEWERAIETLEKAAKVDKTNRTLQQLAAVHLRWGNAEEGYAILNQLWSDQSDEPQQVEGIVDAMIAAGDWERIADFLESKIGQWPDDYRLLYLLGTAYEENGQLSQATQQFLTLMEIDEELPRIAKKTQANASQPNINQYYQEMAKIGPPGLKEFYMQSMYRYQVYQYRQQRQAYRTSGFSVGSGRTLTSISMPASMEIAPYYALVRLGTILPALEESDSEQVMESLRGARLNNAEIIAKLAQQPNMNPTHIATLLEEYPESDELRAMGIMMSANQSMGVPVDFFRESIKRFEKKYPQLALLAMLNGAAAETEPDEREKLLSRATEAFDEVEEPGMIFVQNLVMLPQTYQRQGVELPKGFQKKLQEVMLLSYAGMKNTQQGMGGWMFQMVAQSLLAGDDAEIYVKFLNDEVLRSQKNARASQNAGQFAGVVYGGSNGGFLQPPTFPPTRFADFPSNVAQLLVQQNQGISFGISSVPGKAADEDSLTAALDKATDPILKVLLAHKIDKPEIIEASVKKILAKKTPSLDAYLVAAAWNSNQDQPKDAVDKLEKARFLPMGRAARKMVDGQLVAMVLQAIAELEEKDKDREALLTIGKEAALRLRHGKLPANERSQLISALSELGLTKEADQLEKIASAAPARSRMSVGTYMAAPTRVSTDQIQKLIEAGKTEAAGKRLSVEVLSAISQTQQNVNSGYYQSHYFRQAKQKVSKYSLQKEVLEALQPKNAKNPRKWGEYAAALDLFDKPEEAADAYQKAIDSRPKDDTYRVELIMLLAKRDRLSDATELIDDLGRLGPNLLAKNLLARQHDYETPLKQRMDLFALGQHLLKQQAEKPRADLAFAKSLINQIANNHHTNGSSLGSLYANGNDPRSQQENTKEIAARRAEIHQGLAEAMLEIDGLAEAGFTALVAADEAAGKLEAPKPADDSAENDKQKKQAEAEAKERRSTFAQRARQVLIKAKRLPPGMGPSVVRYSSNSQNVPMRSAAEYLVRHCWQQQDWSPIDDELTKAITANRRTDLLKDLEGYRTLYECDESDFLSKAKAYIRSTGVPQMGSTQGAGDSERKVVEAWNDRELAIELDEFLINAFKKNPQLTQRTNMPAFVHHYTARITEAKGPKRASEWLESFAEVLTCPRKDRERYITTHYQTNSIQHGSPNSRVHQLADLLRQGMRQTETLLPTMMFAADGNIGALTKNVANQLRSAASRSLPQDADGIVELLEELGFLKDPPALRVFPISQTGDESLLKSMMLALEQIAINKKDLGTKIQARLDEYETETLGLVLVRSAMTTSEENDKKLLAKVNSLKTMLDTLETGQRAGLAHAIKQAADSKQILEMHAWIEEQISEGGAQVASQITNARRFEDLKTEGHEIDDLMARVLPPIAEGSPQLAAKTFHKILTLYEDAIRQGRTHSYYGGSDMASQILNQMSHRMDRKSTSSVKMMLAIAAHKGPRPVVFERYQTTQMCRSLSDQHNSFRNQARKAKGNAVDGFKPYVTWLREALGEQLSPLLVPVYQEQFQQYNDQQKEELQTWLEPLAESESDQIRQQLYRELLAAVELSRYSRSNKEKRAKLAGEAGVDEMAYVKHYDAQLRNTELSLSVRLTLSQFLHDTLRGSVLPKPLSTAILVVGTEACKSNMPFGYSLERCFSDRLLSRILDEPDDPTAIAYYEAWHNRFVKRKNVRQASRNNRSNPNEARDGEGILQVLNATYQRGDTAKATQLLRAYENRIANYPATIGLLVQQDDINRAAAIVRSHWRSMYTSAPLRPGVHYDRQLEENLPKLLEKLSPAQQYLAEISLALLPDSNKEAEKVETPLKKRLAKLAERYQEVKLDSQVLRNKALLMFSSSNEASDFLIDELRVATKDIKLAPLASNHSSDFDNKKNLLSQYVNASLRARNLDPLCDFILETTHSDVQNAWRLHNAFRNLWNRADDQIIQNKQGYKEEDYRKLAECMRTVMPRGEQNHLGNGHTLNVINAVAHVRGNVDLDTYNNWREKINKVTRDRIGIHGVDNNVWPFLLAGISEDDEPAAIDALNRFFDLAEASDWIVNPDSTNPQLRQRGGTGRFQNVLEALHSDKKTARSRLLAFAKQREDSVVWNISADLLTRTNAYAEAAQAYGKAAELGNTKPEKPETAEKEEAKKRAETAEEKAQIRRWELRLKQADMLQKSKAYAEALAVIDKHMAGDAPKKDIASNRDSLRRRIQKQIKASEAAQEKASAETKAKAEANESGDQKVNATEKEATAEAKPAEQASQASAENETKSSTDNSPQAVSPPAGESEKAEGGDQEIGEASDKKVVSLMRNQTSYLLSRLHEITIQHAA